MSRIPLDELRIAADALRTGTTAGTPTMTAIAAALLRAREPLATWLDAAATARDASVTAATRIWPDEQDADDRTSWVARQTDGHALAVARRILITLASRAAPPADTKLEPELRSVDEMLSTIDEYRTRAEQAETVHACVLDYANGLLEQQQRQIAASARQHARIKRLIAHITTLERAAAGNRKHVQTIAPELEKSEARVVELEAELDAARRMLDPTDLQLVDEMLSTVDEYRTRAEQAEASLGRARALATQWAVLRDYGSAATELRAVLDEQPTTSAQRTDGSAGSEGPGR
ncbi:hypothetical protein ACWCQE_27650 [Streptomyces sp. NPDC002409]|uniref:hypothetical protein n=1 Tax=Streptomyces misionensis TaxID=67331 RepID=UPI0036D06E63